MQAVRYILNKLWQNLQGVLAATEHNQVVCEDVMVGHVDVAPPFYWGSRNFERVATRIRDSDV